LEAYLDKDFVQLHESYRLAGTHPTPIAKDELCYFLHLASLFGTGLKPSLRAEDVCVFAEKLLVLEQGPDILGNLRPAGDELAVYRIAACRDLLAEEDEERRMDAETFEEDSLRPSQSFYMRDGLPRLGAWQGWLTCR